MENLIRYVEESLSAPILRKPQDLLTTGQAARALGVSIQTIKNWADEGKLETVRLGGRIMVVRQSLLAYLDMVRASSNRPSKQSPLISDDESKQREFIQAGFPDTLVTRLQYLVEAMEERDLTVDEVRELDRLERDSTRIAKQRLREWISQRSSHAG
ncbi:MAG TPA: helix-turn-helix domain-containing protein [Chloroflexota bacterium]|nr:helix-turn-helix domain-containing protein [Chloroflexota bacterium]